MIDDLCIDMAIEDWIIGSLFGHRFINRRIAVLSWLAYSLASMSQ
jgi:hypothetical protein